MTSDIYQATTQYITKYDRYDKLIRDTKSLLLDSINKYIIELTSYFDEVLDTFTVDVRGEYIFLRTGDEITKAVLTAIKSLARSNDVEFEINIADEEKTILIYINSLDETTTTDEDDDAEVVEDAEVNE